jgi:hypothetical protein
MRCLVGQPSLIGFAVIPGDPLGRQELVQIRVH